jgi:chromosome segregation ATPase
MFFCFIFLIIFFCFLCLFPSPPPAKKAQKEREEGRLELKKRQLQDATDNTKTKQQQSEQFAALLSEEEARYEAAQRELKIYKDDIFKHSQILFNASQAKTNVIAEINGAETNLKNLQVKIKKLDADSQRCGKGGRERGRERRMVMEKNGVVMGVRRRASVRVVPM